MQRLYCFQLCLFMKNEIKNESFSEKVNNSNNNESKKQFVIFKIKTQEFGVDIKNVLTIERMTHITRIPCANEYVHGIINLRGEIISILNLGERLDLKVNLEDEESRIIILKTNDDLIGFTVDCVSEIIQLAEQDIKKASPQDSDLLSGIGKFEDRIICLLNTNKLF